MLLYAFILINYIVCLGTEMSNTASSQFSFKKVTQDDLPILFAWFQEPHVQKWYPTPEENETFEDYLKRDRSKNTFAYLASLNHTPIGYIHYYYLDRTEITTGALLPTDLPLTTVGIDNFIGNPHYIGKGYGTLLIKEFITYLRTIEPLITTIVLDPEPANHAAIRCYEKVGFKRVSEHETPWGPRLLMRYDYNNVNLINKDL
jgi:RimJ/RimL family protein N-acetyltransferase